MALLYTEEQKELIKAVHDVAESEIKPHVAAADEAGKTPDELWKWGFDLGLHLVRDPRGIRRHGS
ncbi:MAG: acyl-CoA dehydrogenase family protein [Senegalimassilia faecalis]